ncbi:hypothetical protein LC605_20190 [Nostoc sp. CHAB 5836]|uniref:hypothetical protein n=1 Tax=Nostoc sp. CHAB 5836 TaxID=2780404 RepID=UPI001E35686A|nr:hypothetical protein [Nostoc sp. CHAB 5836]MCC5617364.1 hypothetical protein [Nostoc sp. CHAB 5836]
MRYLYNPKLLDTIELIVEILISVALLIAAIIKFGIPDLNQAMFYIVLAVIMSPLLGLQRVTKRYLLVTGFILGIFVGYFR